jgi:DNA-binding FrmR family transcriptional regulator
VASKARKPQPLELPEDEIRRLRSRLRRLEGQVRGIERMLDERADCHAIVQQMAAARAALDRSMVHLMVSSMAQCLRPEDGTADESELRRLGETFAKLL